MNPNLQITTTQQTILNLKIESIKFLEADYDFAEKIICNLIFAQSPSVFLENAGLSLSYPYQFIQCISGKVLQKTFGNTPFNRSKYEKLLLSLIIYCFQQVNRELDLKYLGPLEILKRFQRQNCKIIVKLVIQIK